ncbi:MAG: hypothetical protein ABJH45_10445, partial [Paracoccaceae bacterium]
GKHQHGISCVGTKPVVKRNRHPPCRMTQSSGRVRGATGRQTGLAHRVYDMTVGLALRQDR